MADAQTIAPESTAVRVALWRALHVAVDDTPHVLRDEIGLQLLAPGDAWRDRPDMDPQRAGRFRVSSGSARPSAMEAPTANRARLWRPTLAALRSSGFRSRRLMVGALLAAGFDSNKPAVISCAGVSVYLTRDSIVEILRHTASLAAGSTFAMTFAVPFETLEPTERAILQSAADGARANGTPFISFFVPEEIVALARDAGFKEAHHVAGPTLMRRYFDGRADDLQSEKTEDFLVART